MTKAGRPTAFKPEFCEQAKKLCGLAATDAEMASFFGVSTRTIYRWQAEHPDFCQALKVGKAEADIRVERSLYNRAVGYDHDAVKIIVVAGEVKKVPYVEHVPPDTTAQIFWLKNRQSDKWRDVHKHEVGHPGEFDDLTDEQLRDRIKTIAGEPSGSRAPSGRTRTPRDPKTLQ